MKDGRYYTEFDKTGNLLKKSFASGETVGTIIAKDDVKDEKGMYWTLKILNGAMMNQRYWCS